MCRLWYLHPVISTILLLLSLLLLLNLSESLLLIGKQTSRLESLLKYEIQIITKPIDNIFDKFSTPLFLQGISQPAWIIDETKDVFNKYMLPVPWLMEKIQLLTWSKYPYELTRNVEKLELFHRNNDWNMDYMVLSVYNHSNYEEMEPDISSQQNQNHHFRYSSKMIMCAISQKITGSPVLFSDSVTTNYKYSVIETSDMFYFGVKESKIKFIADNLSDLSKWVNRPFLFSSASNIEITESICNILIYQVLQYHKINLKGITLLDPCCGSGTMAISALRRGIKVISSDINPSFVEESKKNLDYAIKNGIIGAENSEDHNQYSFLCKDATEQSMWKALSKKDVNCIFCNFPWGENIISYHHVIENILSNISTYCKDNCICCFITKDQLSLDELSKLSFRDMVTLPISSLKKNVSKPGCFITFTRLKKMNKI